MIKKMKDPRDKVKEISRNHAEKQIKIVVSWSAW